MCAHRMAVRLLTAGGLAVTLGLAAQVPLASAADVGPAAVSGSLQAVAAVSARDAWAVGSSGTGAPLIVRWNGRSWQKQAGPPVAY